MKVVSLTLLVLSLSEVTKTYVTPLYNLSLYFIFFKWFEESSISSRPTVNSGVSIVANITQYMGVPADLGHKAFGCYLLLVNRCREVIVDVLYVQECKVRSRYSNLMRL